MQPTGDEFWNQPQGVQNQEPAHKAEGSFSAEIDGLLGNPQPMAQQPQTFNNPQNPAPQPQIMGQVNVNQQQFGQQQYQQVGGMVNPYGQNQMMAPGGGKSRLAGGLLGILLGAFGVHNFYLGYTGKAIAQLLITILSFGILSFIPAIWGLIEGVMILTDKNYLDGDGFPLSD